MKAAVFRRYGPPDVVEIAEVPKPAPSDDEVLVRVRATTISAGDSRLRSAIVPRGFGPLIRLGFGITGPRKTVLGTEIAGDVEAVGKQVRGFSVGDKVFALCGTSLGGHAEYKSMRHDAAIARMPPNLSYEQAAALSFGGSTALYYLRDLAHVQPGEKVLVNGASGCVGTACVQLARHFGAEVTGVCSAANADLVRGLGAAHVIDYAREDFTSAGRSYDVVLDAVGNCPFARCRGVLLPGGRLGLIVGDLYQTIGAALRPVRDGKRVLAGISPERGEDLRVLAELAEKGVFQPVIDRVYPFERIVDAHAHVDTHRKKGSVVVTMGLTVG